MRALLPMPQAIAKRAALQAISGRDRRVVTDKSLVK
jgi:hypothetical protein